MFSLIYVASSLLSYEGHQKTIRLEYKKRKLDVDLNKPWTPIQIVLDYKLFDRQNPNSTLCTSVDQKINLPTGIQNCSQENVWTEQ